LAKVDMKEYARLGAEARVAQLHAELNEIYRAFPGLRARRSGTGTAKAPAQSPKGARRRGRRTMTAAQRREVSQRMKRYWAGRRRAQDGKKKGQA
jgi:hypothetical protein